MTKNSLLVLSILTILLIACRPSEPAKIVEEGVFEQNVYSSAELGWSMKIPEGWTVMNTDKMEKIQQTGMQAVEEVAGQVDDSGLKHLINFRKDQFNVFQSSSEPFQVNSLQEWYDNNQLLKDVIYQTYTNQGMIIDTSSNKQKIDGLEFELFHIKVFRKDSTLILSQDMYSRFINGLDFGVNLSYNNLKDKEVMKNAWLNSKFEDKF